MPRAVRRAENVARRRVPSATLTTGSIGASYEPLLEKYIGRKVVLEMIKGDNILEYGGVLKDYTGEFIEIMDVDYTPGRDQPAKKADLVVPRKCGVVRHLGE